MDCVRVTQATRERVANRKFVQENQDVVVKIMVYVTTPRELVSVLATGQGLIALSIMLRVKNLAKIVEHVLMERVYVLLVGVGLDVPKSYLVLTHVKEVLCGPKVPQHYSEPARTFTSLRLTYPGMLAAHALLRHQSGMSLLGRAFPNLCVGSPLAVSCPYLLPTRWWSLFSRTLSVMAFPTKELALDVSKPIFRFKFVGDSVEKWLSHLDLPIVRSQYYFVKGGVVRHTSWAPRTNPFTHQYRLSMITPRSRVWMYLRIRMVLLVSLIHNR